MKYLLLVYHDEEMLQAMPEDEYRALVEETLANDERLRESGHFISSNVLEFVRSATTVRVREGKLSVTDGPFAETKEQLGGYILIEAKDLDDAIKVAASLPPARIGSIEIRPLKDLAAGTR